MGTRINKMIGYGLADLAVADDGKLVDPRINLDSPLLGYDHDASLKSFLAWLDARTGDKDARMEASILRRLADGQQVSRMDPTYAVVRNAEYGLPSAICLRPLCMTDWHRYDDAIDWIEETYLGPPGAEQIRTRVDVLPHGIYPYNGSYVDTRTGQRLGHSVMPWIQANNDAGSRENWLLDALAACIRYSGSDDSPPVFASHIEAAEHVAPRVPEGIALLAEWGELFTDQTVVYQLRPMRYVWWA